jgi:hypothetical protein
MRSHRSDRSPHPELSVPHFVVPCADRHYNTDPKKLLPEERFLTTLPARPSTHTLVLSDLAGNYDALMHALIVRGFVTIDEHKQIIPTTIGSAGKVIICGDISDREGSHTPECILLIDLLRTKGLKMHCVEGNRDSHMRAFLLHTIPTEIDISETFGGSRSTEWVHLSQAHVTAALEQWLTVDGGYATVCSFARRDKWWRRMQEALLRNQPELVDAFRSHTLFKDPEKRDRCLDALKAARRVFRANPAYANFLQTLDPFHFDNGIAYVHAGLPANLPERSWTEHLAAIKADFIQMRTDPNKNWLYANGVSIPRKVADADIDSAETSQTYCGRFYGITHDRLPENSVKLPKQGEFRHSFSPESIATLEQNGVRALVRGHDSPTYLGVRTQSSITLGQALQVVNVEAELETSSATGYTFITPEGKVFIHYGSAGRASTELSTT